MSTGTIPLHRYPGLKVRLACRSCPRKGQFGRATLIQRVGPNESLVTLRLKIAQGWGCEIAKALMAGEHRPGAVQCGVHYPELGGGR